MAPPRWRCPAGRVSANGTGSGSARLMVASMRRVVVTGVGVVSPCGLTTKATWDALLKGESGIKPIALFDAAQFASRIAGECRGFNPEDHVPKRDVRSMDRFIH